MYYFDSLKNINPFTPKSAKIKTEEKILNFILRNCQKQTAPSETTAHKLSFEWLHTRVSFTDSKVIATFNLLTQGLTLGVKGLNLHLIYLYVKVKTG